MLPDLLKVPNWSNEFLIVTMQNSPRRKKRTSSIDGDQQNSVAVLRSMLLRMYVSNNAFKGVPFSEQHTEQLLFLENTAV